MQLKRTLGGKEVFISLSIVHTHTQVYNSLSLMNLYNLQIGLKYGCPVEDVITGLSIQCRRWRSVYCNPTRQAFLGIAPTALSQTLVQVLLSKYSPALYAHGKIGLDLQLGYCCYCFWAPNSLATLFYSIIPSLYLLRGV